MSEQRPKREATSIKIDPNLWKEAKIEAIRRDMEVSELVEVALRQELRRPSIVSPKLKGQSIKADRI
jgi:post-segregation antitoxin (ccd killing protein)